ncbi:MAG: helix-turn-helix protein [Firmicutes bacterium]|nr:helix-turn-helix protein [Bacillota bacterium]
MKKWRDNVNILKDTRKNYNLKAIDMAKELNISKSYYSMLEKGERPISKNVAMKLKERFHVNLEVSLLS